MIVALLVLWFAQTGTPEPVAWLPVAGSMLAIGGAATVWWRYWRPALESQQRRIETLERDRAYDRIRIELLVRALREDGANIPPGIWKTPPEYQ